MYMDTDDGISNLFVRFVTYAHYLTWTYAEYGKGGGATFLLSVGELHAAKRHAARGTLGVFVTSPQCFNGAM